MTVTAVIAAVCVAAVGCAPEPAPEPELLTLTDAGSRYLGAICPMNAKWDAVDIEVDRLRIAAARGETDADTRLFVDALTSLERAIHQAERSLGDEAVEWPKASQKAIAEVVTTLESDAEQAVLLKEMTSSDIAGYVWDGADLIADSSARAREALGLPADSKTACDLR